MYGGGQDKKRVDEMLKKRDDGGRWRVFVVVCFCRKAFTGEHSQEPDGVLEEEVLIRGGAVSAVARGRVDETLLCDDKRDADHERGGHGQHEPHVLVVLSIQGDGGDVVWTGHCERCERCGRNGTKRRKERRARACE